MFGRKNKDHLDPDEPGWERRVLTDLASESIRERRRARRWGIVFKLLTFAYLAALFYVAYDDQLTDAHIGKQKHTALVDLEGVIAPGELAGADTVVEGLRAAFKDKSTEGIVLRLNSPGGSPVQSSYIYREIKRLREKYPDTPLYAVATDICASGCYYVASAADKIYVNESSIVGSIGVLMSNFGAVDALDKLGLERRLMTAGENKAILDPFSAFPEKDREHVQGLLNAIHVEFIQAVKDGRGERLADDPEIFSGLFWTGRDSVELGLADDFASAGQVARDVIGEEEIKNFTPKEDVWQRLANRIGSAMGKAIAQMAGVGQTPQL